MGRKDKSDSDANKIIHVDFGAGKAGKIDPAPLPSLPPTKEPVTELFAGSEVCRLLSLTQGQLRSLDRTGVASPSGRKRGHRAYTFSDLIALRTASHLLKQHVRLRDVVRAVAALRTALPLVTQPLSELRVVSDGKKVVVQANDGAFEPTTGQMILDFNLRSLRNDVVRILRPAVSKQRTKAAYEIYLQASQLDEDPSTFAEAEALYRQALEHDPYLAIAYTNLGNICFRRHDDEAAEALYRRALEIDPGQAEAHYNLGYVMLERGDPLSSIGFFKKAITADPSFADAYFNMAMAYEHLGDAPSARPYWKRYVDLEPKGTWAEIARKHL